MGNKIDVIGGVAASVEMAVPSGKETQVGGSIEATIGPGYCLSDCGLSKLGFGSIGDYGMRGFKILTGPAVFAKASFFPEQTQLTIGGEFNIGSRALNGGAIAAYDISQENVVVGAEFNFAATLLAALGGRSGLMGGLLASAWSPGIHFEFLVNPQTEEYIFDVGLNWKL